MIHILLQAQPEIPKTPILVGWKNYNSVRGFGAIFAYFLLALAFFCTSCSVVFVHSTKEVHIRESDNTRVNITGSELKDNKLDQESSGELKGVPGI
jgi:hypothetical protein